MKRITRSSSSSTDLTSLDFGKRMRRCGGGPEKKKQRRRGSSPVVDHRDRISSLPEHVLVSILSLVAGGGGEGEIEQVARTSVVCRRWKDLWKYSPRNLSFTFEDLSEFYDIPEDALYGADLDEDFEVEEEDYLVQVEGGGGATLRDVRMKEFVDRVNCVLRGLQLSPPDTIDDFSLEFHEPDMTLYGPDIDDWIINFAVLKQRVKGLAIDFRWNSHNTPHLFIGKLAAALYQRTSSSSSSSLVYVSLCYVNVSGEDLENLLSVCGGSLEELSVGYSAALVNFTVSSLKLKHLEISGCFELERLHIHHVNNLVSFKYKDGWARSIVVIEDAPRLVCLDMDYNNNNKMALEILRQVPHLQTLILDMPLLTKVIRRRQLPKLVNVTQVEVEVHSNLVCKNGSLCARLLEAFPSLTELKLTVPFYTGEDRGEEDNHPHNHHHHHMRVVEFVGFDGHQVHMDVALYMIENTYAIDKMIIDTSHPEGGDGFLETAETCKQQALAIDHLQKRLPSATQLVVK